MALRVGIFGHYGNHNLGDEAIVWSAIQNLKDRIPNIELVGLSLNPDDTRNRFNIESFPIRYTKHFFESNGINSHDDKHGENKTESIANPINFKGRVKEYFPALFGFLHLLKNFKEERYYLRRVRKELEKLDVVLISGSNQLLDSFGGPWGFPYTLFKWVKMAGKTNTRVFFVSVGAGPLSHPLSYWFLKKILNHAEYISFRDPGSRSLINKRIPGLQGAVYPDLAHSLKSTPVNGFNHDKSMIVAINPMPVYDPRYWYNGNPGKYTSYVEKLATFVIHILDKGYLVNLFNNHPKDLLAIEDVMRLIERKPNVEIMNVCKTRHDTVQQLIDTLATADIIVATRFHSTVLPLRLGKPVLGICYYRKSKELLDDVGLNDYYVDIDNFTTEELCDKFDKLALNSDSIHPKLESKYKQYTELMDEQWDRITDLIIDLKHDHDSNNFEEINLITDKNGYSAILNPP